MSRILTIISLCFVCVSTASAAPLTPRNNKALVIKQTLFEDGRRVQGAAISTPTVIGSKNPAKRSEMMRDGLGATPIDVGVLSSKVPFIEPVNYQALFEQLQTLAEYQYQRDQEWDQYVQHNYNTAYRYRNHQNGFTDYGNAYDNCYAMDSACMGPPGNNAEAANGAYGSDPTYALAVEIRRNVPDAAPGAESVILYAQNALMRSATARVFKQAVIDYLRESNIEYAWIDIENELTINGRPMRVASSLQINRSDTPDTPGQYIGASIVPPPGETIVAGRRNSIDVTYWSRSQYPDIFNTNINDPIFNDKASWGLLMWNVTPNGDPVDGTGSGAVQTNGAYDDAFNYEDISMGGSPNLVRTINNINQLTNSKGVDCLSKPLTAGCISGFPNLPTLMRDNNASKGTLTYYGRWELQHESVPGMGERSFPPLTNDVQETERTVAYNLCHDVVLSNEIRVQYRIRRLIKRYDLMSMDGQIMMVPQQGYPRWEVENYVLPEYATYRDQASVSRDPAGGEYGINETMLRESVILNPLTWSAARGGIVPYASVYDSSSGEYASADETWAPRMSQVLTATLTRSSSLPGYVPDAMGRYHYFTCQQTNQSELGGIYAFADSGTVSVSGDEEECRVSYRKTTYVVDPVQPPPDPLATVQPPPRMIPVVTNYEHALGRTACEETCPEDGSSTWKLCPRY